MSKMGEAMERMTASTDASRRAFETFHANLHDTMNWSASLTVLRAMNETKTGKLSPNLENSEGRTLKSG